MSLFEYVSVAVSIVLAFGVTHLLRGLMLASKREDRYWVHLSFVILLLLMHFQLWWGFWDASAVDKWTFFLFVLALLGPVILYMLAAILVPAEKPTNWITHFEENRVRFYIGSAGYIAWAMTLRVVLLDAPLFQTYSWFQLAGVLVLLFASYEPTKYKDRVTVFSVYAIAFSQALYRLNAGGTIS